MHDALARLPVEKDGCDAKAILSRFADRKRFLLMPPRPLNAQTLEKIAAEQVVAVQTAQTGAIGRPGETRIYCADGNLTEYRFSPTRQEDSSAFSKQVQRRLGLKFPDFCEIYLGMGNFLYLRNDLKSTFDTAAFGLSLSELYARHKEILRRILFEIR